MIEGVQEVPTTGPLYKASERVCGWSLFLAHTFCIDTSIRAAAERSFCICAHIADQISLILLWFWISPSMEGPYTLVVLRRICHIRF